MNEERNSSSLAEMLRILSSADERAASLSSVKSSLASEEAVVGTEDCDDSSESNAAIQLLLKPTSFAGAASSTFLDGAFSPFVQVVGLRTGL